MDGFEYIDGGFKVTVVDEAGLPHPHILGPLFDNGQQAWRVLTALKSFIYRSDSFYTRNLEAQALRDFVRSAHEKGIHSMPTSASGWQTAVIKIYEHQISGQSGKSTLDTRMAKWQGSTQPMLEYLRDIENVIPKSVKIPPKRRYRSVRRPNFRTGTICGGETKQRSSSEEINESSALLLNLDLSRTDAEYLENFRDRLIEARAALDDDCVAYVTSMAAHFDYGQRILGMCSEEEADLLQASYLTYREMRKDLEPGNSVGATEISLARVLRLFLRAEPNAKLKMIFANTPWLPSWQMLNFPLNAPPPPHSALRSDTRRFRWMLGLLDAADLSITHFLLSIRNPKFNASPLFYANLNDKHGHSYFTVVVDGISYSVDKRRAKSRKASTLDSESILAIETLLKMTKRARDRMTAGNPLKNLLFFAIGYTGAHGLKYQSLYSFSEDSDGRSVKYFLPKTAALKIPPKHIVPKRLRRTNAVLEWFKTGSILAAARKIGNTTKVIIKHYIPEALLRAWNVRLIRRFQNIFLATAAANEPYLLRATDFSKPAELKKFIDDMLSQHAPSSSKLARLMHERFRHPESVDPRSDKPKATDESSLVIGITPATLAALYAYRDLAYEKGIACMTTGKPKPGDILPEAIIDLADLLDTRIRDHHDPSFRAAHREAEFLTPKIIESMREGVRATFG
ncbi:hypothetical protein [Burkholderia sp. Ax-1719]|uniref:hypothetical protein n=1 Tax=Burkholderia sp. Ax-1719 TaxID=2608334 RepID=UPI0014233D9A|nr:hypothetical protein [Burkholderia sp. Ax-1719]NIE66839.1 hypothetical protein [Burkholderia sp. Ax-1719]